MDLLKDINLVEAAVKALKENVHSKSSRDKKTKTRQLFADSEFNPREKVNLMVSLIRIPKIPEDGKTKPITIKSPLPHSFVDDQTNVLLVVKDRVRIRGDYTVSINHVKERLLKDDALSLVSEIMTYNQVKSEFRDFEAKRHAANRFDIVLCDAELFEFMHVILGKPFYNSKKRPARINFGAKNMKKEITLALAKSYLHLNLEGFCGMTQIGRMNQEDKEIAENILAVAKSWKDKIVGSWDNIRSIHLKTDSSKSIPLYMSKKSPSEILPLYHPNEESLDEVIALDTVNTLANDTMIVGIKKSGDVKAVPAATANGMLGLYEDYSDAKKTKYYDPANNTIYKWVKVSSTKMKRKKVIALKDRMKLKRLRSTRKSGPKKVVLKRKSVTKGFKRELIQSVVSNSKPKKNKIK